MSVCVSAGPAPGDPVWPDPARSHKSSIEAWRPGDTALLLLPCPRCIPPGRRVRGWGGVWGWGVLLIREKETIPWLGRTLFHSLLVEIKPLLYFYVCFLQPLGPFFFFPPSSHAALPQSVLSLINPVSSIALINRTLFTSYTWPARCLKLPPRFFPSLFLSLYLFPSFFFLAFDTLFFHPNPFIHLAFILVISFFEFDWLNSKSCICGGILRPVFTPSFFKVNCSFQWCFSMCERRVFSTDYLPMNMIKVTEHLCVFTSAACMSVLVCFCVLLFREACVRAYVFQKCHHSTPCV